MKRMMLCGLFSIMCLQGCTSRPRGEVLINPDLVNTPQGAYTQTSKKCNQWCHNDWCSSSCSSPSMLSTAENNKKNKKQSTS